MKFWFKNVLEDCRWMLSEFLIIDKVVSYENWRPSALIDKEEYPFGLVNNWSWYCNSVVIKRFEILWNWIVVYLPSFVWIMVISIDWKKSSVVSVRVS